MDAEPAKRSLKFSNLKNNTKIPRLALLWQSRFARDDNHFFRVCAGLKTCSTTQVEFSIVQGDGVTAQEMIEIGATERIFVLTGAGISAASGLPTFRGAGGVWQGHKVEEVASPVAWARDPEMVWKFYSWRRQMHFGVKPNAGHTALAQLEEKLGERFFLCTQNVDRLHEAGGSKRAVHMHGELFKSRCERCTRLPFQDERLYQSRAEIPSCDCGGMIRPHVCWFGERPYELDKIFEALGQADIFLCVGSSGVVEPAASFVRQAQMQGARTYYVGPEAPVNAGLFNQCLEGNAHEVLPKLIDFE